MADETPFKVFETSQLAKGNRMNAGKLGLYSDRIVYVSQPKLTRVKKQDATYEQIAQVYTEDGLTHATLVIETTGGDKIEVLGLQIGTANEASRLIQDEVEKKAQSVTTPPSADLAGEIAKLAALHEDGVLTDEEFSAAKKRMLGL